MVDYGRYYVDPLQYQRSGMNALANSAQFKANENQRMTQNALVNRREDRIDRQNAFDRSNTMYERQRRDRLEKLTTQEKKMQIFQYQIDILGRGLDGVEDEQSYQNFRNIIGQLTDAGKFDPKWYNGMPEVYDPRKIEEAKKTINSLRGPVEQPQLTGEAHNLQIMGGGKVPSKEEYLDFKKASKPKTEINMPAMEKEYDKTLGKTYADEYSGYLKGASEAQTNKIRLERAKSLVTRINTGVLKPATTNIKRVISSLGYDLKKLGLEDDVGLAQALNAVSIDLTMDTVQRTKGAVSNKEMEMFGKVAPQLSNTIEGNLLIIEMANKLNENKIKIGKLSREYVRKNKRFDDGFYDVLDKFHEENPLFTEDIYKRVNELAGAAEEAQQRDIIPGNNNVDMSNMSDEDILKALNIGGK